MIGIDEKRLEYLNDLGLTSPSLVTLEAPAKPPKRVFAVNALPGDVPLRLKLAGLDVLASESSEERVKELGQDNALQVVPFELDAEGFLAEEFDLVVCFAFRAFDPLRGVRTLSGLCGADGVLVLEVELLDGPTDLTMRRRQVEDGKLVGYSWKFTPTAALNAFGLAGFSHIYCLKKQPEHADFDFKLEHCGPMVEGRKSFRVKTSHDGSRPHRRIFVAARRAVESVAELADEEAKVKA